MKIVKEDLERLSGLELRQYAGDLKAIRGKDIVLYDILMKNSVEVKIIAERGVCSDKLYDICIDLQGRHGKFVHLRRRTMNMLSQEFKGPGSNLLSILFDGVYIGEPEDLLNYRNKNRSGILYPTKGFGEKLAEVNFLY